MLSCSLRTAKIGAPVETPLETEESQLLLTWLNEYNEMIRTIDGNALTIYRTDEKTISLKTDIITDKNEQRFRIDLFDFVFKAPLVSIVRNDNDVLAVIHNKKEYYTLTFEYFDFRELTGINIPKEILVSSITGEVYMLKGETVLSSPEDLLLSIEGETGLELVRFNSDSLPVEAQFIYETESYIVNYEKFKNIANIDYPHKITIKHNDAQLEINYAKVKLNTLVEGTAFDFDWAVLEKYTRVN
jgi:hypothetical protein